MRNKISLFVWCCIATLCMPHTSTGQPPCTVAPASTVLCNGTASSGISVSTTPTAGETWSSSNTVLATVVGVPGTGTATVYANSTLYNVGVTTITYDDGSGNTCTALVYTAAFAGTITGPNTVCSSPPGTITLTTNGVPGQVWSSSNTSVATVNASTGVVSAVSSGTATIYYTDSYCGPSNSNAAPYNVTVSSPVSISITGASSVCKSGTVTLTGTPPGGNWNTSTPAIVNVNSGGVVTGGASGGTSTISYTVVNGCGLYRATKVVENDPFAGIIRGNSSVCATSYTTLSTTGDPSGSWNSSDPSTASVDPATGIVTGITAGMVLITYIVTNTCGTAYTTAPMRVDGPSVGISGSTAVCQGSVITLTGYVPGGTWSSLNTTVATVDPATGDVTGIGAGTASIDYTATNACGTYSSNAGLRVDVTPTPGAITGAAGVCYGSTTTLSDPTGDAGGTWSSSNVSIATIDANTGAITAIAPGPASATITYDVSNSCSSPVYVTQTFSVYPLPITGVIFGTPAICNGTGTTLSDAGGATGGTWSSTNTTVATISTGGTVSGLTAGTTTISYSVNNTCGTYAATFAMTVDPTPNAGTITGDNTICVSGNNLLSDSGDPGGWSTDNSSIAYFYVPGYVTGISPGTATVSYSASNSCPAQYATMTMTVYPLANTGTITGTAALCAASSPYPFSDAAPGGVWSSSNTAIATVTTSGQVTGITTGNATISYTVTNVCGPESATLAITVDTTVAAPSILVGGLPPAGATICAGTTDATGTLVGSPGGGTWSSSNTTLATVVAATGELSGVSGGSCTITYNYTNACGSSMNTFTLTVETPITPLITPYYSQWTHGLCVSSTETYSATPPGGVWESDPSVATVGSTTGTVTGVAFGGTGIIYHTWNSCGSFDTSLAIVVVEVMTGLGIMYTTPPTTTICSGTTDTIYASQWSNAPGFGTYAWSTSDATVATVDTGISARWGVVTYVGDGVATITYTITNACSVPSIATIPLIAGEPTSPTISPAIAFLTGIGSTATVTLISGGLRASSSAWSSSSPFHATVNSSGLVTEQNGGSAIITYSANNKCGTKRATSTFTLR